MLIRKASKHDSKLLSTLILTAAETVKDSDFNQDGWRLLQTTNTVEAFNQRFASDNYFALIYEVDGIAVGYIAMIDFEKVDHMFVLPEHRRTGVSKQLWMAARKICEDQGKGNYYWVRSSTIAEAIYESFGFVSSGERQTANGISFRFMEMHTTQQNMDN